MSSLTESSSTVATAAPSYYTDYLSNLASKGTAAGNAAIAPAGAQAWNPNALQTQAFGDVASNVGNYQPGLAAAGASFNKAGATDISGAANPYLTAGTTTSGLSAAQPNLTAGSSSSADLTGQYMNPYTQNVVDQIRLANQQNIQQNLSPGITAGAVGSGQFGSQRGANALALGISNADIGALGAQSTALQTGYAQALAAAQAQRAAQLTAGQTAGTLQNQANVNQVTAGQVAGNMATQQGQLARDVGTGQAALANQTQTAGLADVNALATLGGQEQTIAQNKVLQPLDVLGKQASVMTGAQLPMSTTSTMSASPLSAIASLGALGVGMFTPGAATKDAAGNTIPGTNAWDKLTGTLKSGWSSMTAPNVDAGSPTGYSDSSGKPVNANGTPLASSVDNSGSYGTNTTTTVNPPTTNEFNPSYWSDETGVNYPT